MKWSNLKKVLLATTFLVIGGYFVCQALGVDWSKLFQGVGQRPIVIEEKEGKFTGYIQYGLYNVKAKFKIVDQLYPTKAVSGVTVKAYDIDQIGSIEKVKDPNVPYVDSATSDSSGIAFLSSGTLVTKSNYAVVIDGGSSYYDRIIYPLDLRGIDIEAATSADGYMIPALIKTVKIGAFGTPATNQVVNLTEQSDIFTVQFDFTIQNTVLDGGIEDPVLLIRAPEGKEFAPGAIQQIIFQLKDGVDMGIPGDVTVYLDSPIRLMTKTKDHGTNAIIALDARGTMSYSGEDSYILTTESATYTVKVIFDKTKLTGSEELDFILDDLGDYRARSPWTNEYKASPVTVSITFTS